MKKIFFILFSLAGVLACTTDDVTQKSVEVQSSSEKITAVIVNEGEPMWDGCGWVMYIDSTRYKPVELANEFKVNELSVKITYAAKGTDYRCGLAALPIPEIEILSIEKN